jgi:hypothetical protein
LDKLYFFKEGAKDMCTRCNIKQSAVVGSVVKNVRRCDKRSKNDKGKSLAENHVLMYIKEIATRGEGVYGHVINLKTGQLNKTLAHIRNCEFVNTSYRWQNGELHLGK